ncbi:MAG: choice-of-anchor D domain-containing protein, partial [Candidatus Latescibacterota bacterium]
MRQTWWLLGLGLLLGTPGLGQGTPVLVNGDFSQDWSVGWTRTPVPETLRFTHLTRENGQLTLNTRGAGEVYLYQRCAYQPGMEFGFRAYMESREHLYGIGIPGAAYLGLALLDAAGERIGGLYWASYEGFATALLLSNARYPDATLRFLYLPARSGRWTEDRIGLDERIRDYLPAVDPQQIVSVVVVLGVFGPADESEGLLTADYVSLEAHRPQLSPVADVAFGTAEVGTQSSRQVALDNVGDADLSVTAQVSGEGFSLAQSGPFTIPGHLSLEVRFVPRRVGAYQGTLQLTTNDPRAAAVTVGLSGQGVALPHVQAPDSLRFGAVLVGVRDTLTFALRNTGAAVLHVSGVSGSKGFEVLRTRAAIPARGQADFAVVFAPSRRGLSRGALRVLSDDPDRASVAIPVVGTGLAPVLLAQTLTGGSLDLGRVRPGELATSAFAVQNTGTALLRLALRVDHPAFSVQPESLGLEPGPQVAVRLTFQQPVSGAVSATLTATSNDPEHPQLRTRVTAAVNAPPVVAFGALPERVAGEVDLPYLLADPEQDPLTLAARWSVDDGRSWREVPGARVLADIRPAAYAGAVGWNTLESPGYGLHRVRVRLDVGDWSPGGVAEDSVLVENVAGDLNFDARVDAADVPLFRTAFAQRDLRRELGPAEGQQPYLIPRPDGLMDIEDVQVMVSQLKWFRGNMPAARPVAGPPPRLALRDEGGDQVLVVEAGRLSSGAVELAVAGAPEDLTVQPGAGVERDLWFVAHDDGTVSITAAVRDLGAGMEVLRLHSPTAGIPGGLCRLAVDGYGTWVQSLDAAPSVTPPLRLSAAPNPANPTVVLDYEL